MTDDLAHRPLITLVAANDGHAQSLRPPLRHKKCRPQSAVIVGHRTVTDEGSPTAGTPSRQVLGEVLTIWGARREVSTGVEFV